MTNFSLKNINWQATIQVNLIRSVVGGVVWTIISLAIGTPNAWVALLVWPIGYFLVFLPVGIVAGWLNRIGVPFVGLLTFIPAIMLIQYSQLSINQNQNYCRSKIIGLWNQELYYGSTILNLYYLSFFDVDYK